MPSFQSYEDLNNKIPPALFTNIAVTKAGKTKTKTSHEHIMIYTSRFYPLEIVPHVSDIDGNTYVTGYSYNKNIPFILDLLSTFIFGLFSLCRKEEKYISALNEELRKL